MSENREDPVVQLADFQTKRRRNGAPGGGDSNRATITLKPGDLPAAIDKAEEAVMARDRNIYRYGGRLVTIGWEEIRVSGHEKDKSLRLTPITAPLMLEKFDLAAKFEKWSASAQDYIPVNCPAEIADRYLARAGHWKAPVLLGIVTSPTLRPDGSVLETPGFDAQSGLYYDPIGYEFPPVPQHPSKEDAEAALGKLRHLIKDFPFTSAAGRSVALSAMLTTVVRRAVQTAPLHGFDAPTAGSGKSQLCDVPAIIATGHRSAVVGMSADRFGSNTEFEKNLKAMLLGGDQIIMIDNVTDTTVGGELLNQMLTQYAVSIRLFQTLNTVKVPNTAMVFVNGNNLIIDGDFTRRCLIARIDPGVERPELLSFDFSPMEKAKDDRVHLLVAALTVLRAWVIADKEDLEMPSALQSFEDWSFLIRNALLWLGEADPLEVMDVVRFSDPKLSGLRTMMAAWRRVLGTERYYKMNEIITASASSDPDSRGEVLTNSDLAEAINLVTGDGRDKAKSLGWWLRNNKERVVTLEDGSYKFTSQPGKEVALWRLQAVDGTVVMREGKEDLFA